MVPRIFRRPWLRRGGARAKHGMITPLSHNRRIGTGLIGNIANGTDGKRAGTTQRPIIPLTLVLRTALNPVPQHLLPTRELLQKIAVVDSCLNAARAKCASAVIEPGEKDTKRIESLRACNTALDEHTKTVDARR